jgi:hypothetical protein
MVTYFHHVMAFEAGQKIYEPYGVFQESSKTCVRNLHNFFDPKNTNPGLAFEAYVGICGTETWKLVDYLASRGYR